MATQEDKKAKMPPTEPASSGETTENTSTNTATGKDRDTYDPVGMAGKKAGNVQEIEDQLQQDGREGGRKGPAGGAPRKGKV